MVPHTHYEDKIPVYWLPLIEKKGKVYLSKQTLTETSQAAMYRFLKENELQLQQLPNGNAFIIPKPADA